MVDMYIKTDIERQNRNRAIDPFFEICRRILFERLKFYIYKKHIDKLDKLQNRLENGKLDSKTLLISTW